MFKITCIIVIDKNKKAYKKRGANNMISDNKITIPLNKTTLKQLKIMKQFNSVDNITTYCKGVLSEAIEKDFKTFQEKIK